MASRVVAALASALVLATLAGCAAAAAPDPMNDQFRSALRQQRADEAWEVVATEYPEALRPQIDVGPIRDDAAWAISSKQCFSDEGFTVVRNGAAFQYSSSQGQSPLQFAVAQYHCIVANPSLVEIGMHLDTYQLGALYDYWVGRVRPCLELNGVTTLPPPSRTRFERGGYGYAKWMPFSSIENTNPRESRLLELQRLCPPIPQWLHL